MGGRGPRSALPCAWSDFTSGSMNLDSVCRTCGFARQAVHMKRAVPALGRAPSRWVQGHIVEASGGPPAETCERTGDPESGAHVRAYGRSRTGEEKNKGVCSTGSGSLDERRLCWPNPMFRCTWGIREVARL